MGFCKSSSRMEDLAKSSCSNVVFYIKKKERLLNKQPNFIHQGTK